jgi:hypothetical protein
MFHPSDDQPSTKLEGHVLVQIEAQSLSNVRLSIKQGGQAASSKGLALKRWPKRNVGRAGGSRP